MRMKRLLVATLSGLLFGFVCYGLASGGSGALPTPAVLQIIASRTLMGFAIGISSLRLKHWSIHGLVMGLVFSLPLAFSGMMVEHPEFSKAAMFSSTVFIGMIYGLLIELITSVVCRARA